MGFRDLAEADLTKLLIAAGLEELERALRAGIYPPTDGDLVEHIFLADDYEWLRRFHDREKACL